MNALHLLGFVWLATALSVSGGAARYDAIICSVVCFVGGLLLAAIRDERKGR